MKVRLRTFTPEVLDKLGKVSVYHNYQERYGWTFEQYIDRWKRGV